MRGTRWLTRRRPETSLSPTVEWRSVDLPGRGTTWAIDRSGPDADAPTIVLLHGLVATGSLNWDPLIEPLAEHFRVVALDHRGHGRGIRPEEHFTLEDCADDVVALLDVLEIRRAVLVGYSMGGAIAQLTRRRHPRRVAGLVLFATAARFEIPPGSLLATSMLADVDRLNDRAPITGHSLVSIHEAVEALGQYDARPWLGDQHVPAVVVVTTRDRIVAPRLQREMAALLTEGRTSELAAGHLVALFDRKATSEALRSACLDVVSETGLSLRWRDYLPWRARRIRLRLRAWRHRRSASQEPADL